MIIAKKEHSKFDKKQSLPRILIVDDDPDIIASLKDLFDTEELAIDVQVAGSEAEARKIAESEPIDIALLDIRLGQKNGLDLVPLLKQRNKYINCLMMTAYRDVQYAVNAIRFGADDYLHKPLQPEHILNTINRFLRYQEFRKQKDRAEHWFRTIFDTSSQVLFISDLGGNIVQINEKAAALCNIGITNAPGKKIWAMDPWGAQHRTSSKLRNAFMAANLESDSIVEISFPGPGGLLTIFEISIRPLPDADGVDGYLLVEGRDVTRLKDREKKLVSQAYSDELTGLPNRTRLMEYLQPLTVAGPRRSRNFSLLFMDLDNFKLVNDSFGHAQGDRLLSLVGRVLANTVREGDMVARFSGDEFVAVLHESDDRRFAENVAERIRREISCITGDINSKAELSVSIGIARYPEHGNTTELLLRHADEAMYQAKRSGRNRYKVFENTD